MNLTKGNLIYFSPTSTSKQIAHAIVQGMRLAHTSVIDVTFGGTDKIQIPENEMAVIAVPVYGGRVAPLALQRMKDISGNNTPAVLVVVYGNRAYEQSLMELDAFAVRQGFKVIGAATFIGEHSFHSDVYPIASGRPDKDDLGFAGAFGEKLFEKCIAAADPEHLYPVNVRAITRPKQSFFRLLCFLRGVIKMRKSKAPVPRTPSTDEERCIHCDVCVKMCPTGAIVKGEEQSTDAGKCIRCCACVKSCLEHARSFPTPFAPLLSKNFTRQKQPQTLL